MKPYNTQSSFEKREQQLYQMLKSFSLATNTPIWLYNNLSKPLYSYPSDISTVSECKELIHLCLSENRSVNNCSHDYFHAFSPLNVEESNFGFLVIEVPIKGNEERLDALVHMLDMFSSYLISNNLIILKWKRYIEQFKLILWDSLDDNLSVEHISNMLHVGKTKLYQDFRKYTGTTIANFVTQLRIEKAQDLLVHTELPIKEIASITGFNDYNYFCRSFKKAVGIPAKQYRRRHRSHDAPQN